MQASMTAITSCRSPSSSARQRAFIGSTMLVASVCFRPPLIVTGKWVGEMSSTWAPARNRRVAGTGACDEVGAVAPVAAAADGVFARGTGRPPRRNATTSASSTGCRLRPNPSGISDLPEALSVSICCRGTVRRSPPARTITIESWPDSATIPSITSPSSVTTTDDSHRGSTVRFGSTMATTICSIGRSAASASAGPTCWPGTATEPRDAGA